MKRILVIAQAISQQYLDLLFCSFMRATNDELVVDIITGSSVKSNLHSVIIYKEPPHDPTNLKSRLKCWLEHKIFVDKWYKKHKTEHYDLIFAISNPPINSYIGLKFKKRFSAPFIYMNWDLYPQVIDNTIHNPVVHFICNLWKNWNTKNYNKITKIITIGDVVAESINVDIVGQTNKIPIDVIPIAVDTDFLRPISKNENSFSIQNGLVDKFVILYSGKMGFGHNIEIILQAAGKLINYKEIVFVFIGNGPKVELVQDYINKEKQCNVKLFPLQDNDVFKYSMACGDVGIVSQEEKTAHLFMPSKTYSMMACGEAIIGICTDYDDLSKLIYENQIGYIITNNDVNTLVNYILDLYNNPEELQNYKVRAREICCQKYSNNVILELYKKLFENYLI